MFVGQVRNLSAGFRQVRNLIDGSSTLAENVYEGMFILDANRYARDTTSVSGQVPALIEKCDGEILASRLWDEQKLAYSIKGYRKGTYWLTYFRMDSSKIEELNRQTRLNEVILRSLVLKVEPRLVTAMVQHAKGESNVETDVPEVETDVPEVETLMDEKLASTPK